MKGKILFAQNMDVSGMEYLSRKGYTVIVSPDESAETLKKLIVDCDAVFSKTRFLEEDILAKGQNLKIVAKHGAGIDNVVDLNTATRMGLYVVYTPTANSNAVAEHTIMGMLGFSKKIVEMHLATQRADFGAAEEGGMHEINGKTLGLIGLGNIGRRVAKIAALGFDMKVIGLDCFPEKPDFLPDYIDYTTDMDRIFCESDFVSLHLGLTPATRHLVGRKQISQMKRNAVLLNLARGAVVDESALIEALKNKTIAGAVLDVFTQEPVTLDNPLLKMDNVLLSPHSAALTDEALHRMCYDGARGIVDILEERKPQWCLNYDEVYRKRHDKSYQQILNAGGH